MSILYTQHLSIKSTSSRVTRKFWSCTTLSDIQLVVEFTSQHFFTSVDDLLCRVVNKFWFTSRLWSRENCKEPKGPWPWNPGAKHFKAYAKKVSCSSRSKAKVCFLWHLEHTLVPVALIFTPVTNLLLYGELFQQKAVSPTAFSKTGLPLELRQVLSCESLAVFLHWCAYGVKWKGTSNSPY